ncbi:MAG: hypothetical protein CFE44_18530 [Burkholderiales bacterium PBB4]|nr:MAG: hypothetical protein CFE44_18530 [Burkholderiales bacterium PBB4]
MSAPESDAIPALESLQNSGAAQWSPVSFHFLEVLAQRLAGQPPQVRRLLEAKLTQAVADYAHRFKPQATPPDGATRTPPNGLATTEVKRSALGELLREISGSTSPSNEPAHVSVWPAPTGPRDELKSVQRHRATWSKLRAQKQVAQALAQAPKNAGPINSHLLVLRSLELMRDTSQDYLNRFMTYADTLLCLDQTDLSARAAPRKTAPASRAKRAPRG